MVQISKKLLNHCPEQYPFRAQGSDLEPFLEISAKVKNFLKGQIKPKADFRAVNSPKKRTNEFACFFAVKSKIAEKTNSSVSFLGESTACQAAHCFI